MAAAARHVLPGMFRGHPRPTWRAGHSWFKRLFTTSSAPGGLPFSLKPEKLQELLQGAEEEAVQEKQAVCPADRSVLLFPGQGSQHPGMAGPQALQYPSVQAMFVAAERVLGYDLLHLCQHGPQEQLDRTLHSQPALYVTSLAAAERLCQEQPQAVVEPDLKNNRVLDDLVKNFDAARQHLLRFVLDSPPMSPSTLRSNKSSGKLHSASGSPLKKESACMDSFFVKTKTSKIKKSVDNASEGRVVMKMEVESDAKDLSRTAVEASSSRSSSSAPSPMKMSTPAGKEVQKVDCPVCGVGIPEQYINRHLDSCLMSDEKKESLRSSGQKRRPVTKVVYNLLSDRDLRKKLKEVGLSSQGAKQVLIKRHQEFVHMFNAQCDSLNPKSAAEIVKEIEQNEKARAQLQKKPGENSMTFSKDQSEEEIEGIHTDYRKKHKNEFQFLVAQVKNRWRKSGKKEKQEEEPSELPTRLEDDVGQQQSAEHSVVEPSTHTGVMNESGAIGSFVSEGGANRRIGNEGRETTRIVNDSTDSSNMNECGASTKIEKEDGADQTSDTELLNYGEGSLMAGVNVTENPAEQPPDINASTGGAERLVDDVVNEGGADDFSAIGTSCRSDSPTFPLSPYSTASSSSDILRDLEEVKSEESLDIHLPVVNVGKRKSKSQRTQGGGISTRSKRSRK